MEEEFEKWYKSQDKAFHQGHYDVKDIAYAGWLKGQEAGQAHAIVIGENFAKEIERRANDLGWSKERYTEMVIHSWLVSNEREDGTMFEESHITDGA